MCQSSQKHGHIFNHSVPRHEHTETVSKVDVIIEDRQKRPKAPPPCLGLHSWPIVRQIMLCDWKKKTIQKVTCDLWEQKCGSSVISEHHMSVSNGKRYTAHHVPKAVPCCTYMSQHCLSCAPRAPSSPGLFLQKDKSMKGLILVKLFKFNKSNKNNF